METPTPTRRQYGIAAVTTVALGATGLTLGSGNARAAISLDIDPVTFSPDDGEVYRPFILLSGDWSYQNLDTETAEWQTYALIDAPAATGDDWQAVGIDSGQTTGTQGSGSYALRGAITSHSAWSRSDFTAGDDGSPTTVQIPVATMLILRDNGGSILADAEAHGTAEVTVEHGGSVLSITGTGTVDAQLTPGDPTPTLAGDA